MAQTQEKTKIGYLEATAIGIGGMVGGGIFAVLGLLSARLIGEVEDWVVGIKLAILLLFVGLGVLLISLVMSLGLIAKLSALKRRNWKYRLRPRCGITLIRLVKWMETANFLLSLQ